MTQYLLAGDGRRLTTGGGVPLTADAPGDAGTPIIAAAMPVTMTGSATISALVSVSASLAMTFGLAASPSLRGSVAPMDTTFALTASPSAFANLQASAGLVFGVSASPTATVAVAAAPMPTTLTLTASPSALTTVTAVPAPMPTVFGLSAAPSQSAILPPVTLGTVFGLAARPSLDYGDLLRPPRAPRPVLLLTIGAEPLPVVTPIIPVVSTPTVDGHVSTPLAPPGSLSATVTVDAVQLAWTSNGVAGSSYVIESAPDDEGTAGAYIEEAGTDNLQYTLPVTGARWVRVRARLNGRTSVPTAPVFAGVTVSAEEIELIATQVEQIQVVLPEKASATALTALTTRVTSAEGTLSSHASQINAVNTSLTGKANASAVTALDARVTTAEGGITSYKASWTLTLDAGGRISGIRSVNDGTTSLFEVSADVFRVTKPGGGDALTWTNGVLTAKKGSYSTKLGAGFGSSNNLVLWFGEDGDSSTRTVANAKLALTSDGLHKLGSTQLNLGSGWASGASITYSASAGTPATATISVSSGVFRFGAQQISFNASSASVSGTGGTSVLFWLFYDDPGLSGGSKALNASTSAVDTFNSDGRVLIGSVTIPFPAPGGGSSSGGGSGGSECVDIDSVLPDGRLVRDLQVGDLVECVDVRTGTRSWHPLLALGFGWADCYRVTTAHGEVIQSDTTPMDMPDGSIVRTPALAGHSLLHHEYGFEPAEIEFIGRRQVCKPNLGDRMFFAGTACDRTLATHNIRYKPPDELPP